MLYKSTLLISASFLFLGCSHLSNANPDKDSEPISKVFKDKNPWPAYNKNGERIGTINVGNKKDPAPQPIVRGMVDLSKKQEITKSDVKTIVKPAWYRIDSEEESPGSIQILSKSEKKLSNDQAKLLFQNYLAQRYNSKDFVKPRISNNISNESLDFSTELKPEDIKLPNIDILYYTKIGWNFYAKYDVKRKYLATHFRIQNSSVKSQIEDLHNSAVFSKNIYLQYKFYQEIENLLVEYYRNLGLINILENGNSYFEEDISFINEKLFTFFKIKNNVNFKINKINDRNLAKFINLSLVEKDFSISQKANKYTLFLDVKLDKIVDDNNKTQYITSIDILDNNNILRNTIFVKVEAASNDKIEKSLYDVYKNIYIELNKKDFFNPEPSYKN